MSETDTESEPDTARACDICETTKSANELVSKRLPDRPRTQPKVVVVCDDYRSDGVY